MGGSPNYPASVLVDGPNHFWLFNNASFVTDIVSTASVAVPAGLITGQPGVVPGLTSASCTTNCVVDIGTSNVNNFGGVGGFTYEFVVIPTNLITGSAYHYVLVSNQSPVGNTNGYEIALNYNSGDSCADGTPFPINQVNVSLTWNDTSGNSARYTAACNVSNAAPAHVVVVWTNTVASTAPFACQVYFNGNIIDTAIKGFTAFTISKSTNDILLLNRSFWNSNQFRGTIQSIASFNYALTEDQVEKHFLAFSSNFYQPNAFLYSNYKGKDTAGNNLFINSAAWMYNQSDGYYYVMGQYFGADYVINTVHEATNSTKITSYRTQSLSRGTFAPYGTGFALDATGVTNPANGQYLWAVTRPAVVFNPNIGDYVMWTRAAFINTNGTQGIFSTNYRALISTSMFVGGPYTIVVTNLLVGNSANQAISDFSVYANPTSSNAFVVWDGGSTGFQNTDYVQQLSSDYLGVTGNYITLPLFDAEGLSMFRYKTNFYIIGSNHQPYEGFNATNLQYWAAISEMGPWTLMGNPSVADYQGTGFEGQGGSRPFQLNAQTNTFIQQVDYWYPGMLSNSAVSFYGLNWFATNQNFAPLLAINPAKRVPLISGYTNNLTFPDVTSGLQNRWLFAGNGNDSQGGANNILVNSPTFTSSFTALANTAIQFNGTTQYATNNTGYNISNPATAYTITGWFQEKANNGSFGRSVSEESGSAVGFSMQWASTGGNYVLVKDRNFNVQVPYTSLTYGSSSNWVMISTTWDGSSTWTVYVDGQLFFQTTGAQSGTGGTAWGFGTGMAFLTQDWPGAIAIVSLYNRALTQAEIYQLFRHEVVNGS
jgi:hypothetical protein